MKKKITEMNYGLIKRHIETHSWEETAKEFDLSKSIIQLVKRSTDYKDLRYIQKTQRRASYELRKKALGKRTGVLRYTPPKKAIDGTGSNRTAAGGPFGEAVKPKPIPPLGDQRAPEQDGPVTTVKTEPNTVIGPMAFDDYRREYKRLSQENGTLRGEVAVAKMEVKKWQEKCKLLRGDVKRWVQAYNLERAKVGRAEYDKNVAMQESKVENTAPTEIEITVGDATIKVSTKGVTNVNI